MCASHRSTLATLTQSKRDGYRVLATFTQADVLLQKNDLMQASVIMAAFAYNAAMRDAMMPRTGWSEIADSIQCETTPPRRLRRHPSS